MAPQFAVGNAAAQLFRSCRNAVVDSKWTCCVGCHSLDTLIHAVSTLGSNGTFTASHAALHTAPTRQQELLSRVKGIMQELASELKISAAQLEELEALKGRSALVHAEHLISTAPELAQQQLHERVHQALPNGAQQPLPFSMHLLGGLLERQIVDHLKDMTPEEVRALADFPALAAEARARGAAETELEEAVKALAVEAVQYCSWEDLLPLSHSWLIIHSLTSSFPALERPLSLLGVSLSMIKQDLAAQQLLDSLRKERVATNTPSSTSPSPSPSPEALAANHLWQTVQDYLEVTDDVDVTMVRRLLSLPTYTPVLGQCPDLLEQYQKAVQELAKHIQPKPPEVTPEAATGSSDSSSASGPSSSSSPESESNAAALTSAHLQALVDGLRSKGDGNAVEALFSELLRIRHEGLLAGPCQQLLSVKAEELKALPDDLFKSIRRRIFNLQQSGRQPTKQLLDGSASVEQLRSLPQEEREALVWNLIMDGTLERGKKVLCAAQRHHVLTEEWRCLNEFDQAKRAVETHLIEDLMVDSHPSAGLQGDYKPMTKFKRNRFLDMLKASGVPGSMISSVGKGGGPTPEWMLPDGEARGSIALGAVPPAQQGVAKVLASCPIVGNVFIPTQGSSEFLDYQQQALMQLATSGIKQIEQAEPRQHLLTGWTQSSQMRPKARYKEWMAAARTVVDSLPEASKQLLADFTQSRVQNGQLIRKRGQAREAQKKLAALYDHLSEKHALRAGAPEVSLAPAAGGQSLQEDFEAVAEHRVEEEMGSLRHMVQVLLGEKEARKFSEWFMAEQRELRGRTGVNDEDLDSFEIFQKLQMGMDEERYLRMQFEPEMHLDVDSLLNMKPSYAGVFSKHEPSQFLDSFQPYLNKYLEASGHAPLQAAEWKVYKTAALWDLHTLREAGHLHSLKQGESGWFHAKRDSAYLQALLRQFVPASNPFLPVGLKYLAVVDSNPSWKFAHKRHLVLRVIELSRKLTMEGDAGLQSPLAAVLGEENLPLELGVNQDPEEVLGGKRRIVVAAKSPKASDKAAVAKVVTKSKKGR